LGFDLGLLRQLGIVGCREPTGLHEQGWGGPDARCLWDRYGSVTVTEASSAETVGTVVLAKIAT
jgi:hypothetical protein